MQASYRIIQGDCQDTLKTLPEQSVHCCVTSPPYYNLRDYGVDGQIGLEATPDEYIAKLVDVFRAVRRVLRDDGTCWINMGLSYASDGMNPSPSPLLRRDPACGNGGIKSQDFQDDDRACPDCDGERQDETPSHRGCNTRSGRSELRGEPQPLQTGHDSGLEGSVAALPGASLPGDPSSTTPESSCQPLDVFCPASTDEVCQPAQQTSPLDDPQSGDKGSCISDTFSTSPPLVVRIQGKESFFSACDRSDCKGIGRCGLCWCSLAIPSLNVKPKDEINTPHLLAMALQADGWFLRQTIIWHKPNPMPESVTDRCTKAHEYLFLLSKSGRYFFDAEAIKEPATYAGQPRGGSKNRYEQNAAGMDCKESATRNKRSVWSVNPASFKGAHFAVFPPKLIEPCILAGCPEGGTVLDPFAGSGTTAEVALKAGRNAVLCELNPEYLELQKKRLAFSEQMMLI